MNKLLISASALVLGVALSSVALAEANSGAIAKDKGSVANSSAIQNGTDSSSVVKVSNTTDVSTDNTSLNSSKTSNVTDNSGNTTNRSDNFSSTTDSHNAVNSSNSDTDNFSKTNNSTTRNVDGSYDNTSGSWNKVSNTSFNVNAALSLQLLDNSVSGVGVHLGEGEGGAGGNNATRTPGSGGNGGNGSANASSNLSTGAVNSSGANDFSGIQTANFDSGFGAAVQGGTGLAATSSISFSDSHH
jgi:hypothetical protein